MARPKTMRTPNPATETEEAPEGSESLSFPAGLKALAGRKDKDRVWMANVSLREVAVHVSDEDRLNDSDESVRKAAIPIRVSLKPFGGLSMLVGDAKRELRAHQRPGGPNNLPLMVEAPEGNCRKSHPFTDRETGVEYESCPYVRCLTHPAPNDLVKHISILQSQHRVSTLGSIPAIERWIGIDGRLPVMLWGHRTIARRRKQREEDLGIGVGSTSAANVTY